MDLFGVGPMEAILILMVALIMVGPERLPEMLRTVSRVVTQLRRTANQLTSEVMRDLDDAARERQEPPPSPRLGPPPAVPPEASPPESLDSPPDQAGPVPRN
ncbi:MAG: twin-arginine translocase TatA/TatE family subunit [Chloroflexi bacterium]|nr:twin-arginine translocase TatA/TatE family subunit [Chloroflexota bacterium]